jgi:phosphomannomutase
VQARTGHAFLKAAMRETGAVYGGEMSAHHYFRDFMACDSGMIPWLLVAELMGRTGRPLSALVGRMRAGFPRRARSTSASPIRQPWSPGRGGVGARIRGIDRTDGLSLDFGRWRVNLRASNTEPLLRLNVEASGDAAWWPWVLPGCAG